VVRHLQLRRFVVSVALPVVVAFSATACGESGGVGVPETVAPPVETTVVEPATSGVASTDVTETTVASSVVASSVVASGVVLSTAPATSAPPVGVPTTNGDISVPAPPSTVAPPGSDGGPPPIMLRTERGPVAIPAATYCWQIGDQPKKCNDGPGGPVDTPIASYSGPIQFEFAVPNFVFTASADNCNLPVTEVQPGVFEFQVPVPSQDRVVSITGNGGDSTKTATCSPGSRSTSQTTRARRARHPVFPTSPVRRAAQGFSPSDQVESGQ
jgi:hypothetical protein